MIQYSMHSRAVVSHLINTLFKASTGDNETTRQHS